MENNYFYADIYECINYDKEKGFKELEFISNRTIGNMKLGEIVSNSQLIREGALVKKIDEDTYYSEEYNEFYHLLPSNKGDKYLANLQSINKILKYTKNQLDD